ncbi:hypothetical protein K402DRAFT_420679 [Aulographum hederae CBS 113979]|uniref:Uncharacterized protein n=1 Tax=Aulographum hederae CBS 113979 TaxID=1176131 RepID=A0A6G1H1I4_9PEZI|nr:hypothetical protein K402DRAFT_420679 [Aulographum hederae CBS 113979]
MSGTQWCADSFALNLSRLLLFGLIVFYENSDRLQSEKVTPRGIRGRFVSFADESNGSVIKVWKEGTRQIIEERNFSVDEDSEPYNGHRFDPAEDEDLDFGTGSVNQTHGPNRSSQSAERRQAIRPATADNHPVQNSPHEREQEEPHEPNPAEHQNEPESEPEPQSQSQSQRASIRAREPEQPEHRPFDRKRSH